MPIAPKPERRRGRRVARSEDKQPVGFQFGTDELLIIALDVTIKRGSISPGSPVNIY